MILNDEQIRDLGARGKISPFEPELVSRGVISFGTSSFGYDARVKDHFRVFSNLRGGIIDPKNFDEDFLFDVSGEGSCVIPPNSFALAETVETFDIPDDVMGLVVGKSTYARCGAIMNTTPLEPAWVGTITIEISNTAPLPMKIYSGEGTVQVLFLRGERPSLTYADRKGKYQHQSGVTLPRVI